MKLFSLFKTLFLHNFVANIHYTKILWWGYSCVSGYMFKHLWSRYYESRRSRGNYHAVWFTLVASPADSR